MVIVEPSAKLLRLSGWPPELTDTLKRALLYTAALGLLAHAFAFFNLHPSGDGLSAFYSDQANHHEQMSLGRVLVPLYRKLTASNVTMPWAVGALALLWIGLAVFLTACLFQMHGRLELLALAGIFTTNRTIVSLTSSFLPWLGIDTCSLMLGTAAAVCWRLYVKGRRRYFLVLGAGLVAACLSLYQSFLPAIITLIMLRSALDLLQRRKGTQVFANGLWGMGMIAAGCVLYFGLTVVVCRLAGVQLLEGTYNSVEVLWTNDQPVLARIAGCFQQVGSRFLRNTASAYPQWLVAGVNLALLIFCAAGSAFLLARRRIRGLELALFVLLACALPVGADFMQMLSGTTHDLMYFAFWLLYLPPLFLVRQLQEEALAVRRARLAARAVCLCLSFVIFANIQTANLAYTKKEIQYNATLSLMNHVMYSVDRLEGYVDGETTVAFVGLPSDVLEAPSGTGRVSDILGVTPNSPITYNYSSYFRTVLQRRTKATAAGEIEQWEAVQQMPRYPQPGYAAMIDGVAVVRFR